MKTLKKTLCLVLAMVMVFGLCAVSASAKLDSYKDKDTITYAEAVDVLSGIGILKGDESGFRPKANITRAEAAKIIAYIVIGNATQADSVKASVDPFTDVPAGHWAAGYIAYCATRGIVGGMGDGSYHPDEPVSGLAFAKMLLCALGYGQKDEYVGGDWSVKTASDAIRYGVFDDNLAGASEAYATREECALYAYNVVARNRGTDYDTGAVLGLKKVTYSQLAGDYVTTNAFGSGGQSVDANKAGSFAADYKLSTRPATADNFKRETGHEWFIESGKKDAITAKYDDSKLKAVYTTDVTGDDIYNLLGKDAIEKATWSGTPTVEVYIDGIAYSTVGADGANADPTLEASYGKGETKTLGHTGNGVQTYVYQWWTEAGSVQTSHIKICIINTYLAKVKEVNEATAKRDAYVEVELVDSTKKASVAETNNTIDTEDFDKGDYVLVTVSRWDGANEKVETIAPATVLETEITRVTVSGSKRTLVADGTTYELAKVVASEGVGADDIKPADATNVKNTLVDGKDHVLYIDEYGYLISLGKVSATSEYVYVAQYGWKNNAGDDLTDKGVFQADIYYADGSHKIVPIDITKKADGTGNSASAADNFFHGETINSVNSAESKNSDSLGVFKLNMVKGKAVLTRPSTGFVYTASSGNALINKGVNNVISGKVMDSKTVFYYVHEGKGYGEDDYSVTAYTGINNVPLAKNTETVSGAYIFDDSGTTKSIKVLQVESDFKADSGKVVYLYLGNAKDYDKDGASVTYHFYKDGEIDSQTYTYADADKADTVGINVAATGFVTLNTDGSIKDAADRSSSDIMEVNKVYYISSATVDKTTVTATTIKVTSTGTNANAVDKISLASAKIVDVTGIKDSNINNATKLEAAVKANSTVNVAIAYDEYNQASVVYVLSVA